VGRKALRKAKRSALRRILTLGFLGFFAWPFRLLVILVVLMFLPVFFALAGTSEQKLLPTSVQTTMRVDWDAEKCATLPAPENRVCEFGPLFNTAGAEHKVDPRYLAAIAYAESGYREEVINCTVTSNAPEGGARGIMQFMPSTAAGRGVDPCNPASAIMGAAKYLREMYDEFGSWELAAAGYNAGPGAVRDAGNKIPPFAETQAYVPKVMGKWSQYMKLFNAGPAQCGATPRGSTEPDANQKKGSTPAMQAVYDGVVSCFGREYDVGCQQERDGDLYEHPRGRACDFMITNGGKAHGEQELHGRAMAEWVMANAEEFDVIYVIWYDRIWSDGRDKPGLPWGEWRDYDGGDVNGDPSSGHTNHVHVSVHYQPGDPPGSKCPHSRCTD
jgi:hypothetical protein